MSIDMLKRTIDEASRLIEQMSPEDFAKPSPCEGWVVRDVVNHITGGATMFAISAESGSVPDEVLGELMAGDNLGDDPVGAWQTASQRAIDAFADPSVMEKMVKLPFGEMPAGVALNIAVFDVATHCGDLAKGSGKAIADTALLDAALDMAHQMLGPELRVPGVFGPEQPAPPNASSLDRLMAFTGRQI